MPSESEVRIPISRLQRNASSKDKIADISTPVLNFPTTVSRDDLYTLPSKSSDSEAPRPQTSDGPKTRKRLHVADLLIDQAPRIPSSTSPWMQKTVHSPGSIGVALGSPTHSPWTISSGDRPSLESRVPSSFAPSPVAATIQSFGSEETSKVQPKRNLFSSIFGRKTSNTAQQSLYRSQTPQSPPVPITIWHQSESEKGQDQQPITPRRNQITRRPSVGQLIRRPSMGLRPKVHKAATMPIDVPAIPKHILLEAPNPPPKDPMSPSSLDQVSQFSPLLKVDIPDVRMERYSVMFSDVLKPRQSLLARRRTQLRELHINDDSLPILSELTPELLPIRRATVPSPRSPRISLFPAPPSASESNASRRTGLSRSNTLPSPNRQTFATDKPSQSKRKDTQTDHICSPSHGSETPMSMHSDWPSDGSIDSSELSDEGCNDNTSEEIIIQLGDLTIPHGIPMQTFNPAVIQQKQSVPSINVSDRPSFTSEQHQPRLEGLKHSPRIYSRAQFSTTQSSALPSPAVQRKPSLPTAIRSIGGITNRQNTAPSAFNKQQAISRPIQYFNPLQSSPATPKEITIARQLSLSRSQSILDPIPKTSRQPRLITIVNPDSLPAPRDWKVPVPLHMRNKSEHIVLESV